MYVDRIGNKNESSTFSRAAKLREYLVFEAREVLLGSVFHPWPFFLPEQISCRVFKLGDYGFPELLGVHII